MKRGAKSEMDLTREKAKEILKTHHPQPLDKETLKAMDDVIAEAKKKLI